MKKIIYSVLVVALFSFYSNSASAQMGIRNANFVNLGLGVGVDPGSIGFNASYEHGFFDAVSIGGIFDVRTGSYDDGYYGYNYHYRKTEVGLAFRGSYHFNKLMRIKQKNVDIYAGAATGVYINSYSYDDNGYSDQKSNGANFLFGIHGGAKYFISDRFGFFSELSSYNSIFKIGIALQF